MFGHHYFGAHYFAPRYFADGGVSSGGFTPTYTNDLTTAVTFRLVQLRTAATPPPALDSTGLLIVDLKAARDAVGAQLKDQNTDLMEYLN